MSYVCALFHIVFSTKRRSQSINNEHAKDLYAILGNEIRKLECKPIVINGMPDHIHILLGLNPLVSLSNLMREVKSRSSVWARQSGLFPEFDGWESEYGAFSLSRSHMDAVYQYIKNQQVHHMSVSADYEMERLVDRAGLHYYRG